MANDSSLPADMDTLVMERDVQGWQGMFRTNPAFHLMLAFFVGIVAGLGAVAFRRLIGLMHNAFRLRTSRCDPGNAFCLCRSP